MEFSSVLYGTIAYSYGTFGSSLNSFIVFRNIYAQNISPALKIFVYTDGQEEICKMEFDDEVKAKDGTLVVIVRIISGTPPKA